MYTHTQRERESDIYNNSFHYCSTESINNMEEPAVTSEPVSTEEPVSTTTSEPAPAEIADSNSMSPGRKMREAELNHLNTTNHVYIRDDAYAWIPARVEKIEQEGDNEAAPKAHVVIPEYKDERSIQSDGGRKAKRFRKEVINLKDYPNQALPLANVDEHGNLKPVEDMVDLSFLHEVCYDSNFFITIALEVAVQNLSKNLIIYSCVLLV